VVLYGGGGGEFLTIGGTGGGSHLRCGNLKPSLFCSPILSSPRIL